MIFSKNLLYTYLLLVSLCLHSTETIVKVVTLTGDRVHPRISLNDTIRTIKEKISALEFGSLSCGETYRIPMCKQKLVYHTKGKSYPCGLP